MHRSRGAAEVLHRLQLASRGLRAKEEIGESVQNDEYGAMMRGELRVEPGTGRAAESAKAVCTSLDTPPRLLVIAMLPPTRGE